MKRQSRHLWVGAAFASAAFALAPAAMAQTIGAPVGRTFVVGTLQGTVQSVDLQRATITIDTGSGGLLRGSGRGGVRVLHGNTGASGSAGLSGTVTLNARPFDIMNVTPGDVVALDYSDYNGNLWVQPTNSAPSLQSWAQTGTFTGPVTGVNRAQGLIEVRGQRFRAHPEDTQGLFPGQFVSLTYAMIGSEPWVSGLEAGAGVETLGTGTGTSGYLRVQPQMQQPAAQQPAAQQPAAQQPKEDKKE